jgi:hypothetical protein
MTYGLNDGGGGGDDDPSILRLCEYDVWVIMKCES